MVTVNTTPPRNIHIKQLIDIENSPYIIITPCGFGEQITNCCLIHCRQGKIYLRKYDKWSSLSSNYFRQIRDIVLEALNDEQIPKFTTDFIGLKSILN